MQCDNRSHGQQLYNETSMFQRVAQSQNKLTPKIDWFMLCGEICNEDFIHHGFKGNTYHNLAENPDIFKFFDFESEPAKISEILHSIFDSAATRGETWTRQDWLCADCIRSFLDRHKMNWWLDRKRSCL
jgi:hypothetical protein